MRVWTAPRSPIQLDGSPAPGDLRAHGRIRREVPPVATESLNDGQRDARVHRLLVNRRPSSCEARVACVAGLHLAAVCQAPRARAPGRNTNKRSIGTRRPESRSPCPRPASHGPRHVGDTTPCCSCGDEPRPRGQCARSPDRDLWLTALHDARLRRPRDRHRLPAHRRRTTCSVTRNTAGGITSEIRTPQPEHNETTRTPTRSRPLPREQAAPSTTPDVAHQIPAAGGIHADG